MIKKRKVFFVWQMDKEKKWLEEMAKEGYILKSVKPFSYTFTKEKPQNLCYQFDFQMLSKEKEQQYLELFEDWTFISRYGGWFYFYKDKEDGKPNKIYSDQSSRKNLFLRIIGFLVIVGFPLYYQILIVFPNMDSAKLVFPKFYFFARIVVMLFMILWLYAITRILFMIRRFSKNIQE